MKKTNGEKDRKLKENKVTVKRIQKNNHNYEELRQRFPWLRNGHTRSQCVHM